MTRRLALAISFLLTSSVLWAQSDAAKHNSDTPAPAQSSSSPTSPAPSSAHAVPDSTKIELVKGEKAIYPLAAEEKKLQGQVWVRLHISETGDVEGVDVVSGDPILAEAAVNAVKKWKFKPYIKNGHPVKVLYKMPMDFAFRENVTPVPVENKASVDRNPSGAQDSTKPPVIPQSGRIQNIVPEEMWKRLTQCVFPIFPQLVETAHITGTVDIGLGISPAGDVGNYRVLRSDHPLLIQPALDAIRQWKF